MDTTIQTQTQTQTTEPMATHKQYFALAHKLSWGDEERAAMVAQYSRGATESLGEMVRDHHAGYAEMIAKMQQLANNRPQKVDNPEADRWRKRCMAVIAAWIDSTGTVPSTDRSAYIKSVACRTAGKTGRPFNQLSIAQLRTVYNSFLKQNEALMRASTMKKLINPQTN